MPIGLVALVAGARRLPADDDRASRRIDLRGVAALSVTVLLVVLPLVLGRADGWPAWTWVCFAASVPALALFVATQRGRAEPLVNLHALAPRPVAFGLAAVAAPRRRTTRCCSPSRSTCSRASAVARSSPA